MLCAKRRSKMIITIIIIHRNFLCVYVLCVMSHKDLTNVTTFVLNNIFRFFLFFNINLSHVPQLKCFYSKVWSLLVLIGHLS